MAEDEAYWKLVRSAYAIPADYHFLNTGTKGTQPYYSLDRMHESTRTMAEDPWEEWKVYNKYIDAKLPMVAEFVGADPDEIALMYNTTDGLNAVIHGLKLKAGDEVLLSDQEHPSGNEPWRLREKRDGIVIKHFPTGTPPAGTQELVDAAENAITPKTKVLSISHLCYTTSLLMPVKELSELARSKGLLCIVDGAHPLGMIKLNMHELGCDFYSGAGQKWLGGPLGSGLLYVKKEHLEWLDPTIVSGGWDVEHGAGKFMARSSVNTPTWAAFVAAMEFQNTIGREKIEKRVRYLAVRLRDGLAAVPGVKVYTSNDPAISAGLTTFSIPFYKNNHVLAALNERYRLYPRTIGHDLNAIRVSTHIISPECEIDMMIDAVADIVKHGLPTISESALKRAGEEMAAIEKLCA
jgi:isopenicillin-N epimerase